MARLVSAAVLLISAFPGVVGAAEQAAPWRLEKALNTPDWLSIDGAYRLRYETLDHPFRAGASGSDEILVGRLFLNTRVTFERFYAHLELQDSRQWLADAASALGTDSVNALEPLQALAGMRFDDIFTRGARLDVSAGRMTIDIGSRRLVARNSYRNTINAYSGVHALWRSANGEDVRAFYVRPMQRKPSDLDALLDNDVELDSESSDVTLWGLVGVANLPGKSRGEAYFYGLRTRDHPGIAAADRDIYTPGFRVFRAPATRAWDFETEVVYQFGTSRSSTAATDINDLQHRAGFFHGELGYTLDAPMSPRLEVSYDYASGDDDPNDNENNRFDTLYGARRFDFGPTGIYGPVARSNINTPGVRIEAKPNRKLLGMLGYRAIWLASERDQFVAARLQDRTGQSGSFVGHQIEAQFTYTVRPVNLVLEVGSAYLIHGRFLEDAPNAPNEGDTTYIYAAATTTF